MSPFKPTDEEVLIVALPGVYDASSEITSDSSIAYASPAWSFAPKSILPNPPEMNKLSSSDAAPADTSHVAPTVRPESVLLEKFIVTSAT